MQQEYNKLLIKAIIQETPDTKSFILEPVDYKRLNYKAGQFLILLFEKPVGEEDRRNYSFSSSPDLDEPLTITVKRLANGTYSRWLIDKAKEGDTLLTIGASGFFILPDDLAETSQLVFFAAGSGIVPMYSLIKTALHLHQGINILLIYSNTSPATTIFIDVLKKLREEFSTRFKIAFLFSTSPDLSRARLNVDLVTLLLQETIDLQNKKLLYYLCGPFEYMRMITIALQGNGVPAAQIKKEIFNIEKPAKKTVPPDKEPHEVTVFLNEKKYQFNSQYPVTILQSAKALQIPMPYSCESGQCGTCAATCIKGKVWMWHNDVLMDDEIARGRVLTCTGYAVGSDVVLRF